MHAPSQGAEPGPIGQYRERALEHDLEAARLGRRVRALGRIRLALFACAVGGLWWLGAQGRWDAAMLAATIVAGLFTLLVARHRAARRRMRKSELMAEFNRQGIARIRRDWAKLPRPEAAPALQTHPYATDLDLFGHASLFHLIGICGTAPGKRTLSAWLLEHADPATINLRQEAIREMAAAFAFRDRLAAEARLVAEGRRGGGRMGGGAGEEAGGDETSFLAWAEGDPWLGRRRLLRLGSLILPPLNLTAIALWAVGAAPVAVVGWSVVLSTLVLAPRWKAIRRAFIRADDGESGLRSLAPLLGHLCGAPLQSPLVVRIRDRLGRSRHSAPREIATLRRLLDLADLWRSPLFHLPLALVLHWDLHILAALERWQARSGARVREWIGAIGEMEALAALATLAADHPDWTMPHVDPKARTLHARDLGHPLLPPPECIRNDVDTGSAGSFLLVTGSNMSGKSTLLRAIGLNAVLAQTGAPACATSLTLPPLSVMTSMRVNDSLADGVSFFMAELQRLKGVVDAARASPIPVLYLLDEILQGTNSAERQIAARTVIRLLLESGAIGAVTTHDLGLADTDDLMIRATPVHLRESIDDEPGGGLRFDYRLQSGIATSTNALRMLRLVGLSDED